MGIEVTIDRTDHKIRPLPEQDVIVVVIQSTQELFRVTGWSPVDGLIEQAISLRQGEPGTRIATLDMGGDFHIHETFHFHAIDRYFAFDHDRVEVSDANTLATKHRGATQLSFGDLRSRVAMANQLSMEKDGGHALRAAWIAALTTLEHIEDPSQQGAGGDYLADHIDRFLQRHTQPRFEGTPRQAKWAKDIRLRALQRSKLHARDLTTSLEISQVFCAILVAQTQDDANYWIAVRELVMGGSIEDLLAELLTPP